MTGVGSDLLVDDEDPVRLFSAWALHSRGDKVAEARNGEVSIDILNAESFDRRYDHVESDRRTDHYDGARKTAEILVVCISDYTDE